MDTNQNQIDDEFDISHVDSMEQQSQQKKRRRNNKFDAVIETMTEISNKKIETFMKFNESDIPPGLRDFFGSVSRSVATFNSYDQAIIKKKIMDLVTEYELKTLEDQLKES